MTESKAIELLEYIRETGNGEAPYVGCAQNIAIEMAINALKKQEKIAGRYEYETIEMLEKSIENSKTAYDVDKVIEELNELDVTAIKRYEGGTFGNYKGTDYYIKKSDAIEIVKQGGVSDASDYVCEWRLCDEEANVYDTSCRNPHILIEGTPQENNYEFCPYCGKKILCKE